MAGKELDEKQLMGRLMADLKRAGELGLLPADGASISQRGDFIVSPSNVDEIEERKRVRQYREYGTSGKTLHAWGKDPITGIDGPLDLVVKNQAEEANAVALGWSPEPVHGPGGKLIAGAAVQPIEDVTTVREFAAPGQVQPDSQAVQTGTTEKAKAPAKVAAPGKSKPKK